jgi:hypothetical protein
VIPVARAGSDSNPRGLLPDVPAGEPAGSAASARPAGSRPDRAGWPASRCRAPGRNAGPPGIRELRDRRRSRRAGPAIPRNYRWCCCTGSSTGPLGAVMTPACRCTPDPVPPPSRHCRSSADRHFSNAGRVGNSPRRLCDSTCGCTFADSIVAESPAPARGPASGPAARTGNADDAHSGPGLAPQSRRAVMRRMRSADCLPLRARLKSAQRAVTRRRPCQPWQVITPEAGLMRSRQDGAMT